MAAEPDPQEQNAVDILLESLKDTHYIDHDRLEFPDNCLAGNGGFGVVSRAILHPAQRAALPPGIPACESAPVKRTVAVKKLTNLSGIEPQHLKRIFVREALVWSGISHPNILAFIGFYLDVSEPAAWLISEWEPFGNIKKYLAGREVSLVQKLELLYDTGQALAFLHTRTPPICHGDIKSLNVLVTQDIRAVLCDFGQARIMEDEGFEVLETSTANLKWSFRWCSPELFDGQRTSAQSDMWAWGWLAWEVVTGKLPFPNERSDAALYGAIQTGRLPEPTCELAFANTPGLWELASECWHKNPALRPSAEHRVRTLERILASQQSEVASVRSSPKVTRLPKVLKWLLRSLVRKRPTTVEPVIEAGDLRPVTNANARRDSQMDQRTPLVTLYDHDELDLTDYITKQKSVMQVGRSDVWQGTLILPGEASRKVSLKILRAVGIGAEGVNSPDTKERLKKRLQRELRIWTLLKSPRIVPCLGFATVHGFPCLISPWFKNGNVQNYVKCNPQCNRKAIIAQVAEGLNYLHSRLNPVVHCDVKSLNIMIDDDGRAMLTEFGISKIMDDIHTGLTTTNAPLFTTRCVAPEVLDGQEGTTQSDIFSFACFVLELMSGQVPWYDAKTPARVMMARTMEPIPNPVGFPTLPADDPLWNILNTCWAPDPKMRPTMEVVLRDLEALGYRA